MKKWKLTKSIQKYPKYDRKGEFKGFVEIPANTVIGMPCSNVGKDGIIADPLMIHVLMELKLIRDIYE